MKLNKLLILTLAIVLTSCGNQSSSNNQATSSNDANSNTSLNASQGTSNNASLSASTSSKPSSIKPNTSINSDINFDELPESVKSYYNGINLNSKGESLVNSLKSRTNNGFKSISYDGLWSVFQESDNKGNNKVWDMYSNYSYSYGSKKCGNYRKEGDCYNREHSVPKSWYNDAKPAYSDAFHLYPTDGYVNGRRSNYAFGEVGSATYTSQNGSKLGSSSFPGYSGTVFEPIDEYKGDFARSYFYFAVKYNSLNASNGNGAVVFNSSWSKLTTYAVNLFMKWAEEDPVSEKEINRNNAVYNFQKNRNPFIDMPNLMYNIWQDYRTL